MEFTCPADEYEAAQARRRKTAEHEIRSHLGWTVALNLAGAVFVFMGGESRELAGTFLMASGWLLLLPPAGAAVWLAVVTLRASPCLSWFWRVLGIVPWAIICGEAILFIVWE